MMKYLISIVILFIAAGYCHAQTPQLLNYQGVARDSTGAPLAGVTIGLNLIIHSGSLTGTIVYEEAQAAVTNNFGLYHVAIGSGTTTYNFDSVNWASGAKYLEVQIDPSGGTSYTSLGASQLLSVPYALYAAAAAILTDTTLSGAGTVAWPLKIAQHGATTGQLLKWNGTSWMPATSDAWSLNGNTGISPASDFLGTRDTASVRFRVNDAWAGELNVNKANATYGPGAGMANTTGYNNAAIGARALLMNTTGYNNTAAGDSALYSNTTGYANTANGINALAHNTTGVWNVAVGEAALATAIADSENTALGAEALTANTTGSENTGVGVIALAGNTTGRENTAVGEVAMYYNTAGYANTAVGGYAMQSNTTGSFNTAVGYDADVSVDTLTNASAFGSYATANASNKVVIGASTVTTVGGYSSWTNLSDGRFKTDVQANVPGLTFINKLRPVTYRFQARKFEQYIGHAGALTDKRKAEFDQAESKVRTGFVAQDVEKAATESRFDFSGLHVPQGPRDNYSLAYAEFTVPLVKAVQELSAQNAALEQKLDELTKRVTELERQKK